MACKHYPKFMPKPLSSFEVASDCVVSLRYHDDQTFLASARAVAGLVPVQDYPKIKRSLKVRRDYINKHLPSWAKVVVVVTAMAVVSTGAVQATRLLTERFWNPPQAQPSRATDGLKLETERRLIVVPPSAPSQGEVSSGGTAPSAPPANPRAQANYRSDQVRTGSPQASVRGLIHRAQKLLQIK